MTADRPMDGASVTVVIPCFNSGATISHTLASVRSQTWSNLDIIIVDDGSTDAHTLQVLQSFSDIRVFRQSNQGLSHTLL